MSRSLVTLGVMILMTAAPSPGRPAGGQKTDGDVAVPEGQVFKLSRDTITVAKEPGGDGRRTCTVKAAAAPTEVKMKAQKWALGFVPAAKKDRVEIERVLDPGPLQSMRSTPKMAGKPGDWLPDPGDVITHVNGYAVKSVQDVVCAVNAAEDPDDIQLVVRDVNDGKQYVFYVSAAKK
ncbi:MAG TPA: hypothetical protein VM597_11260 [Gemmataceae bacterium]|jgi:S1-C subfamily serine protease|nr:hypothetical protein [Gemmataceae bacterium]